MPEISTIRVILPKPNVVRIDVGNITHALTEWGDITGTLSNQTDLQAALDAKIGGSIADEQIAFGIGTDITGSDFFYWDSAASDLGIGGAGGFGHIIWNDSQLQLEINGGSSSGPLVLYGPSVSIGSQSSGSFASTGDIKLQKNFEVKARNHDGDGDLPVLSMTDTDVLVVGDPSFTNPVLSLDAGQGFLDLAVGTADLFLDSSGTLEFLGGGLATFDGGVAGPSASLTSFLKLTPTADPPVSPAEGMVYADTDHNIYRYDGTSWIPWPDVATPTGSQLINGGGVAWTGTGFNYIISAAVYLINGVQYSSAQTPVTLTNADNTFDRIDVFYVDTSGLASFITGTPAANPVAPSVDPVTQLYLTFAYVPAGSTSPVITNVNIYLENTEYTMSTNSAGTINLASTNNPYAGTKCIEGTATATGNFFTAVKPSGTLDISPYQSLVFQIRSKATWPNPKSLSIFWLNGTTVVGTSVALHNGVFGFDSAQTSSYQQIVIPVSSFNTGTTVIDRLRVAVAGGGGNIGWYIDNIILQTGSGGGGGGGDFSTNTNSTTAGRIVVFADTTGKLGTQAVAATGWTSPTGVSLRTGYATTTATLNQVSQTLKALIEDLTTRGLLGP